MLAKSNNCYNFSVCMSILFFGKNLITHRYWKLIRHSLYSFPFCFLPRTAHWQLLTSIFWWRRRESKTSPPLSMLSLRIGQHQFRTKTTKDSIPQNTHKKNYLSCFISIVGKLAIIRNNVNNCKYLPMPTTIKVTRQELALTNIVYLSFSKT